MLAMTSEWREMQLGISFHEDEGEQDDSTQKGHSLPISTFIGFPLDTEIWTYCIIVVMPLKKEIATYMSVGCFRYG